MKRVLVLAFLVVLCAFPQKKKPKDKAARPVLQPLTESPQNVELIRKPRKPRHVAEDQDQG